jgi:hypothetical protein
LMLRCALIGFLFYFAWFQGDPWCGLDGFSHRRSLFEPEFLRQGFEQLGAFLMMSVPFLIVGLVRSKISSRQLPTQHRTHPSHMTTVVVLTLAPLGLLAVARFIGSTRFETPFWVSIAVLFGVLLIEFARRISNGDLRAYLSFGILSMAAPVTATLSLWS